MVDGIRQRRHRESVRKAAHDLAVRETAHLVGRDGDVVRPLSAQVGSGHFAWSRGTPACRGGQAAFYSRPRRIGTGLGGDSKAQQQAVGDPMQESNAGSHSWAAIRPCTVEVTSLFSSNV